MGEVVGLTAGVYDLTHEGHIRLFERIRERADKLVSVVHDDRSCYEIKGKIPVQDLDHRLRNLGIIGLHDEIVVTTSADPADEFREVVERYRGKGDTVEYFRGDDLTAPFPGSWLLEEVGVPITYLPYTQGVSSTQIRSSL